MWGIELLGKVSELAKSLKLQVAVGIGFGIGFLLLVFTDLSEMKVAAAVICSLAVTLAVGSIIERILAWRQKKKDDRMASIKAKAGEHGKYVFTDKLADPWPDPKFPDVSWEILRNTQAHTVFLIEPICTHCRTDLVRRLNASMDGFDLDCPKCKKVSHVDDVSEARHIADSLLQGELRTNPGRFFRQRIR